MSPFAQNYMRPALVDKSHQHYIDSIYTARNHWVSYRTLQSSLCDNLQCRTCLETMKDCHSFDTCRWRELRQSNLESRWIGSQSRSSLHMLINFHDAQGIYFVSWDWPLEEPAASPISKTDACHHEQQNQRQQPAAGSTVSTPTPKDPFRQVDELINHNLTHLRVN